jgi:Domain of unknown function (DUF6265)
MRTFNRNKSAAPALVMCSVAGLALTAPARPADQSAIAQMDWLAGIWKAQALGGEILQVFEPANNGEAISTMTLTINGKITRYELRSTREQDGKIMLHEVAFGADMAPAAPVPDRALVLGDATHANFEGLSQVSMGDNKMKTDLTIHSPDGTTRKISIEYTRVERFAGG